MCTECSEEGGITVFPHQDHLRTQLTGCSYTVGKPRVKELSAFARDNGQRDDARLSSHHSSMNSIIVNYDYELELLEDILKESSDRPTDLVVCSSKGNFLEQLVAQLDQSQVRSEGQTPPLQGDVNAQPDEGLSGPRHTLLSRTLHILGASQLVNLVFCPTIPVLRGYLSGYVSSTEAQPPGPIIILNLLAMHHGTSEFTLQGLSQTLATAVSAAHRTSRTLKLVECKDITDPLNPNRGPRLWQAEVQLLSAAIKIGEPGQSWGRRTMPVMRIASRWFRVDEQHERHRQEHRPVIHARSSPEDEMLI